MVNTVVVNGFFLILLMICSLGVGLFFNFNLLKSGTTNPLTLEWAQNDTKGQDYFLYMKATYQHLLGKPKESLNTFKKLNDKTRSVYANDGLVRLLFDLSQYQKIINLEDIIKEKFADNLDLQLMLAQSYLNLNKDKKSEELFQNLVKKYPDNDQIAYYTAVSYIKNKQLNKGLDFILECLNKPALRARYFLFHFLASKIYLNLGINLKALNHIRKSLELRPNFEQGLLLKALLDNQLGNVSHAIKGYQKFLDIVGSDLAVEKQLAQLLFSSKKYGQAARVLRKMRVSSSTHFFNVALMEWKSGDYDQALKDVNFVLKRFPNFKKAKILKIEVLLALNKKEEALDFATQFLEKDPNDFFAVRLFVLLQKTGIPRNLIVNALEKIAQQDKKSKIVLAALADLYIEEGNLEKVIKCCNELDKITCDNALKSKILFQIAYCYFEKDNKDKNVEQYLHKAIKCKPVYPSVYNLLAYYYAQNNKNLENALKLSDRALGYRPNCYYYLDTKGYVLLKLGNIDDAIYNFKKALAIRCEDDVVKQHLYLAESLLKK